MQSMQHGLLSTYGGYIILSSNASPFVMSMYKLDPSARGPWHDSKGPLKLD